MNVLHFASACPARLAPFQKEPITNLDYRVGESLGRLLRKIVPRVDDTVT
jgi:hypothetical protein